MGAKRVLRACIVAALVAGVAITGVVVVRKVVEHNNNTLCVSCLSSIGYICHMYAEDSDGVYPPDLGKLLVLEGYSKHMYTDTGLLFICPSADHAVEFTHADLPPGVKDASGHLGPKHTDYAYVSGLTSAAKAWWVLAFDKTSHPGGVRNVARVGSDVVSMSEAQFKREIERTLREARAAGFDAKVWGYAPGEAPRWLDDLNRIPVAPDE